LLIKDLINTNKQIKIKALELYHKAHAGHIGSSLSCIDLISSLYLTQIKEDDEFILSKGHAAVALYTTLHFTGKLTKNELESYYKEGTKLPAHPAPHAIKGITFATGSLGHGFPLGCGIAHARKLQHKKGYVFVLLSDGETNEGTSWEAAHFAARHKLDNLMILVDKNKIQGINTTAQVLGDTANFKKWENIGFDVKEINGHNLVELVNTVDEIRMHRNGRPKMIIANTIKGKGVSFMENTVDWHYWPMSDEQYKQAVNEIKNA
jgi:transketolase